MAWAVALHSVHHAPIVRDAVRDSGGEVAVPLVPVLRRLGHRRGTMVVLVPSVPSATFARWDDPPEAPPRTRARWLGPPTHWARTVSDRQMREMLDAASTETRMGPVELRGLPPLSPGDECTMGPGWLSGRRVVVVRVLGGSLLDVELVPPRKTQRVRGPRIVVHRSRLAKIA